MRQKKRVGKYQVDLSENQTPTRTLVPQAKPHGLAPLWLLEYHRWSLTYICILTYLFSVWRKRKEKERTGKWKWKWNQNFPCWKFDEGVCIMSLWSVKGEKGLVWDHQEEIKIFDFWFLIFDFFFFFFYNLVGLDRCL